MKREFRAEVVNDSDFFVYVTSAANDQDLRFYLQPEIDSDGEITALSTPDSMGDEAFLGEYEEEAIDAMQDAFDAYKNHLEEIGLNWKKEVFGEDM